MNFTVMRSNVTYLADVAALAQELGVRLYLNLATDKTFLFRADTHDRHVCPPEGAAEHDAFVNLMTRNQEIAQAVDSAWAEQGIPTFKTWLREDLARREKQ